MSLSKPLVNFVGSLYLALIQAAVTPFSIFSETHHTSGESRVLAKGMPPKKFIYNLINLF
jgi:hypothetical protein